MRFTERCVLLLALASIPTAIAAQEAPRGSLELSSGYAGFLDEAPIDHGTAGGAFLWRLSRRVSVGPELVYMIGPCGDRDVFVTGRIVVDLARAARVSPYFVTDGGVMFHRALFVTGPFWSREAAGAVGAGIRVNVTDRLYVAPEVRIGWEPHIRLTGVVGWRLVPR